MPETILINFNPFYHEWKIYFPHSMLVLYVNHKSQFDSVEGAQRICQLFCVLSKRYTLVNQWVNGDMIEQYYQLTRSIYPEIDSISGLLDEI